MTNTAISSTTLGEITEGKISQDGPPKEGEFVYVDIGSIDIERKRIDRPTTLVAARAPSRARQRLRAGDVLVSMTRPNRNAVAIVPPQLDGAVGSTGFHVLRSRGVEASWLYYAVQTNQFVDAMCGLVQGALYPAVRPKDIRGYRVSVPSRDEQRQIVAEIEKQFTRLDAGVAALRRTQANLKRYRAAVLKAAFEGRLVPTQAKLATKQSSKADAIHRKSGTPDFESGAMLLQRSLADRRKTWKGRGNYKDPVAPNTSSLPAPPEGWTWASIDQLTADSLIGLDRGRAHQSENAEVGVPYVKMNNVTMDGRVIFDDMMYVPASEEEFIRFAIRAGDILFNTRNSSELVGKVGLVRSPPAGAIYNNNLMRIRVSSSVLPPFLSLQMCSQAFRQRMELVKKATTNVAAVYAKDLWPLPIALPPLAEQTRIVAEVERRLSVVEELEMVVNASLRRAARLRESILNKAFTGKPIIVDPNETSNKKPSTQSELEGAQPSIVQVSQVKVRSTPALERSVASVAQLIDCLIELGGEASPEELLVAANFGDDVERFFDLLREGQTNGTLIVPTGEGGLIRRKSNAT